MEQLFLARLSHELLPFCDSSFLSVRDEAASESEGGSSYIVFSPSAREIANYEGGAFGAFSTTREQKGVFKVILKKTMYKAAEPIASHAIVIK